MQRIAFTNSILAFLVAGLLAVAPALAQNDRRDNDRRDNDRRDNNQRDNDRRGDDRRGDGHDGKSKASNNRGDRYRGHFDDRRRVAVHDYYQDQFRHGRRCPPGLSKKHDGCMATSQSRRWNVGRPLPKEVVYYSVPPAVVVQIGLPPSGHRYVRVASDILLISIGTGLVVDAIQNLGRM